jgi:agmatine/peptidylarginine deiminase
LPEGVHPNVIRPFAEYERAATLVFTGSLSEASWEMRVQMARYLPRDMTLMVLVDAEGNGTMSEAQARSFFGQYVPQNRLKVVTGKDAGSNSAFWFHDSGPIPVWGHDSDGKAALAAVDINNWHGFEPDAWFLPAIGALPVSTGPDHFVVFQGGNFMADTQGNCFLVGRPWGDVNDPVGWESYLRYFYGCTSTTILPYSHGIGHVDEVAKLISDDVVFTDVPDYVPVFKDKGYRVVQFPRPKTLLGTYLNSLIINGTVFVPIYNEEADLEALNAYRAEGLTVVPVDSFDLSSHNSGSIHCITMTYPRP